MACTRLRLRERAGRPQYNEEAEEAVVPRAAAKEAKEGTRLHPLLPLLVVVVAPLVVAGVVVALLAAAVREVGLASQAPLGHKA